MTLPAPDLHGEKDREPVLSVAQMRAAERAAITAGISEYELMRRAGEGAAQWVVRMAAGRRVCVLCGLGNNGGDGYVIAAALQRAGIEVDVIAPREPVSAVARDARSKFDGEVRTSGRIVAPVVVDCLFGYGLNNDITGDYAALLEMMGNVSAMRIAIDVPSGIEADTGRIRGPVPPFDLTLALGAWKLAHFTAPASSLIGGMRLVPIGLASTPAEAFLSGRPVIAPPAADAHKYSRGLLTIVGGAMPGASILAAEAAMRSGAGYVRLLSDPSHPSAPADLVIREGNLDEELSDDRTSAFLIGPGLGRGEDARRRLAIALDQGKPTVIDADALHLLDCDTIEGCDVSAIVLTPHDGELAALCQSFGIPSGTRLAQAKALHGKTGMTVLAKGRDTALAGEEGAILFPPATPWLSTAGTGDVLAGLVASRLAVHGEPQRAATEGVCLHAEAARIAAPAFSASDLVQAVRPAMASFL